MKQKLLQKIEELEEEMIQSIRSIVQINSVRTPKKEDMPYGEGIQTCLDAVLSLASALGFETENVDNQAGIVKYGDGEDYIGIFGHLDVVEVGEGWTYPAFGAFENENGRIFGRGILDNKGPILSNLYALYALKELKIPLKHPIWIIFGTNEESGFADMKHYLKKKPAPFMGWTPDCKYPVVYAERGRSVYEVRTTNQYQQTFFSFVNNYFLKNPLDLKALGLNLKDKEFGEMQVRNLHFELQDGLCFSFTFSYPASICNDEIETKLRNVLDPNLDLTCMLNYNPVYFDKEGFLCNALKNAYESITAFDGTPVTTTGGTYAKVVPNIVPFGPSFPNQKGIGHLSDEWMDRTDLMLNAKIYILSMYQVANELEVEWNH